MKTIYHLIALVVIASASQAEEQIYHHENVLGTSLELRIRSAHPATAKTVEQRALRTIDELCKVLSAYDADSEFSRWQRGGLSREELSRDLKTVLQSAETWRQRTDQAFDIRAGALTALWKTCSEEGRLPTDNERRECVGRVQNHDVALPVSLDGLAKGYILDSVCREVEQNFPDVTDFTINIGGDIRKLGNAPLQISVTDPFNSAEGAKPILTFACDESLAIATSGGYRRHFEIDGRKFSHIVDPRNGFPQNVVQSASVIAPTATDADAAATALCVLGPEAGVEMINSLDGFECMVLSAEGRLTLSNNWPKSVLSTPSTKPSRYVLTADKAKAKTGLLVYFKLDRPKGRRYRRPYVAVWLEDKDGFPVKTAVLWMQTDQPGPRWHRDLTRWYRNDRMRQLVEKTKMIGTVSSATRGPGEYQARFDGTDNDGKLLPSGTYTLCIEAAREHGTYQIIRKAVTLADKPIKATKLKGNVEVSEASYSWTPLKEDGDAAAQ